MSERIFKNPQSKIRSSDRIFNFFPELQGTVTSNYRHLFNLIIKFFIFGLFESSKHKKRSEISKLPILILRENVKIRLKTYQYIKYRYTDIDILFSINFKNQQYNSRFRQITDGAEFGNKLIIINKILILSIIIDYDR